MPGSSNNTPRKKGVQEEIDDLVNSVNKFSQEFESLRKLSSKIFKEREAAQGKVDKATASLVRSKTEYEKALDKFEEAEAGRVQAAVDIGMSLRFWSVGEQALSEPNPRTTGLTPKQTTVVEALKKSQYCIVDGFITDKPEAIALHEAVHELYSSGGMSAAKSGGGRSGTGLLYKGFRHDFIKWASDSDLQENPNLTPIYEYVKKLHSFLQPLVKELEDWGSRYIERGDAMIACFPGNGAHYKCHSDNPHNNSRLLTCILYLNPGWVSWHGGQLKLRTKNSTLKIKPKMNRLLIFCSKGNIHEVLPCQKERFAITVWIHDSKIKLKNKELSLLSKEPQPDKNTSSKPTE